eukprot:CAMPEP_0119299986 /NCGR_PEP_ID=MMETSP1333-20130426/1993_1 /TAXON_ID=418940 /ORGANISM="Scyphosphaera apsteinii, Strain RCC1455" /LENGTH=149 /DNA_ID=CAMNT_0007301601 /DNA_START=76 /DNA_END=522 /DNA_ORIENTATION=-
MTIALPVGWIDASDLRPVPDNQEVWLEHGDGDRSLVVELLERVHGEDSESAVVHFQEIAATNDAVDSTIRTCCALPNAPLEMPTFMVSGIQRLRSCHEIKVVLALLRLEQQNTDIVMSLSNPKIEESHVEQDDNELMLSLLARFCIHDW